VIFKGTPYELPAEGILSSLKNINTKILQERLLELKKTKKVLYLTGPSEVNHIQNVIRQSCNWTGEREAQLSQLKDSERKNVIHFVPIPKANQAQIKIGRFISSKDFSGHFDEYSFLSGFLGGGFTSKLVQELRVKRGLTYSAGSYISMQREYGRAGISTFSKNETTLETLKVIKDVLKNFSQHKMTSDEFKYHKNRQIGGFAFGFEETTSLLFQIMLLDHQKRNSQDLLNFPKKLDSLTLEDFLRNTDDIFVWDNLDIIVVGDPSLIKILSKLRKVEILDIKDFL
jgi:zinc protease